MDKINDIIKRDPLKACEGCPKMEGFTCPVYPDPTKAYPIRVFGICPFNAPEEIMTAKHKQKIRAGQQKSKAARRKS